MQGRQIRVVLQVCRQEQDISAELIISEKPVISGQLLIIPALKRGKEHYQMLLPVLATIVVIKAVDIQYGV